MSNIFFIGDTHFGDKQIVNFSKPRDYFSSYSEMEETIINNWNSVISKKDEVWILGDICITKKSLGILKKLNGTHKAVLGNHDTFRLRFYYEHFKFVSGAYKMYIKGVKCILTHIPIHTEQLEEGSRYTMNVHGHLHCYSYDDLRYFNVNADQINLVPVPLEVLEKRVEDLQ